MIDIQTEDISKGQEIRKLSNNVTTQKKTLKLTGTQNKKFSDFAELRPVTASSSMIRLENEIEKSLLEASDSIISETSLNNSDFVKNNNLTKITKSNKVIIMKFVKLWEASYIIYIFPIHTFVNIPALLLKNTTRFLSRAGIY